MLCFRMILVGLTGGLATGKSTVARLFQDCGAHVIHADDLAHQAVQPGKPAWKDIVRTFGTGVLHADRSLNRDALAKIVFRDPAKLRRLNAIVHPRVAREQARLAKDIATKHPLAVIIYDVPLLFEAGVDKRVDKIIVVTADRDTQIKRLLSRNGLTRTEALRRIRAQMPLSRKIPLADEVLDGTRSRAKLRRDVGRIYRALSRSV